MNPPPLARCSGAVLVGGHSRRMGRDKALIPYEGQPLWRNQVATLRRAGVEQVAIVRRHGQPQLADDVVHWTDESIEVGPVAGLEVALKHSDSPFIAVLAVDLPRIDVGWFHWMWAHCGAHIGAVAWLGSQEPRDRRATRRYEPLAAIYPRSALPLVNDFVQGPGRSLQQLVSLLLDAGLMTSVAVPAGLRNRLNNWNIPTDVSRGKLSA